MTIYWQEFVKLGGSLVLIPIAFAIFAWLLAGRAWRMAWLWGMLFTIGLAMVAITQIAFIGWGIEISVLDFQGFSGHSMRTAAVMPLAFFLVLQNAYPVIRIAGVLLGMLLAAMMGFAVSVHDTHSASEAIGGCILGYAVCFGFIRISKSMKQPVLGHAVATAIGFGLVASLLWTSKLMTDQTYKWMTQIALGLSGSEKPFARQY